MAETIGSLVDKLSIVELKLYHMREFAAREHDMDRRSPEPTRSTMRKINVLCAQRAALADELTDLAKNPPKPFHQFKMYNDPQYRTT